VVKEVVESWKQWKVGQVVRRRSNVPDIIDSSRIKEGKKYTVTEINPNGEQPLRLTGAGIGLWWVAEKILIPNVTGICADCINTCIVDKKKSCDFKETLNNGV